MGAADAVPGVSGGTMALIMGIYEQLLAAISSGFRMILAAATGRRSDARSHFDAIQWRFILPLAAGIAVAIGVASIFIPGLLERFPVESRALFLGLVGASLAVPWARISDPGSSAVLVALAFAVPAFILSGLPSGTMENPAMVVVFAAAAIAICAMILPGVSGSFLLLVFGMYEPTLDAVRNLDVRYIVVFAVGAVVGLGSFATLLRRLLDQHHDRTMAALVGLMLGSLRALWPWQSDDRSLLGPGDNVIGVVALVAIGFVIVTVIQRSGSRSRHPSQV